MVLPLSHRIPRVLWYSGYTASASTSHTRLLLSSARLSNRLPLASTVRFRCPYPVQYHYSTVWALSLSLTTTQKIVSLLSFPPGTKMFQFPGFPLTHYWFMCQYRNITYGEFPHSDICGSRLICSSPQLFAACHVLLRRLVPRHPPYALLRLIVYVFVFLLIRT